MAGSGVREGGVNHDLARATTRLRAVALARVVASGRQRVIAGDLACGRRRVAAVAFTVVLLTTVGKPACLTSLHAVGDGGVVGATKGRQRDAIGQATLGRRVGVAAHQAPVVVRLAREEGLRVCAVDYYRDAVASAACLRAVALAWHVAIGAGGVVGGQIVATEALICVLGTAVLVAHSAAALGTLLRRLGGGCAVRDRKRAVTGAAINKTADVREARRKSAAGARAAGRDGGCAAQRGERSGGGYWRR